MAGAGLFVWGLAFATPASTCEVPTTVETWRQAIGVAEAAWGKLDLEGLRVATDSAAVVFVCLGEPLAAADAARAHRLHGLRADVLGAPDLAARAFLAARRLDPEWRFPASLPESHPLRRLYGREALDTLTPEALPAPRGGELYVDGAASRTRFAGVPAVVQWRAADGTLRWTGYLQAEDHAVGYPLARTRRTAGWTLVGVATASAVVSGVSYGVAADARDRYDDLATPPEALDELRATTNTGFWVSVGTGAGAAGALLAAALVFRL